MFFDDRLATVLRQRADSDIGKRTQFRQLLDILGAERRHAARAVRDPGLIAAAWLRMDALGRAIPAIQRARMIREPGWRFRSPALVAHLAEFEPEVAAAALTHAQLTVDDWTALIPRLPVRARGFVRLRRDLPVDVERLLERLGVHDRGLPAPPLRASEEAPADEPGEDETDDFVAPPPFILDAGPLEAEPRDLEPLEDIAVTEASPEPEPEPQPAPAPTTDPASAGRSEISALVERIAQFRREREGAQPVRIGDDPLMPRLPLGEEDLRPSRLVKSFGFAADAAGRIEWADGKVAASVIGARLIASSRTSAASHADASANPLARAITRRQPIRGAAITLDGAEAIAGDWVVDAQPRFTEGGHFAGYVGRFRRPGFALDFAPDPIQGPAAREADRIRQLLHELRTPVTAVQGYAEVIQQQLFGSAPHEYRALAAAIAADAARILAGFEELDRLARLETGVLALEPGETDLGAMARRITAQLAPVLGPRMAGIDLPAPHDGAPLRLVAVGTGETEALLWRLLATLGGGCSAGEMLEASLSFKSDKALLTCDLPAQLLEEEDIFTAEARPVGSAINAGLFGAGFALRLARAEARAAGGSLVRADEQIVLALPLAVAGGTSEANAGT